MTPERYALAKRIFLDACDRAGAARDAFLDDACGHDAELRGEVESLLAHHVEESGDEEEPPEPPAGRLAARYRVVTALGKGGMGRVFQAVDERFNRTVALKELVIPGARFAKAFEREARLLNGLRHRALPVVTDYFVEEGKSYLVMDFVAGRDLAELTKERIASGLGLWPEEIVLEWADRVLDALEYLASFSPPIVHRDIKPPNLKLTPAGDVVLLDFGLAKGSVGPPSGRLRSVPGFTPSFSPLEQLRGGGTDPRTDLYALGATIYFLLVGTVPPDAVARAEAVVAGRPDPLVERLAMTTRPALAAVLSQALALHRDERLPSARAMRALLREVADAGGAFRAATTETGADPHETLASGDTAVTLAMPSDARHNLPEQMTGFIGREAEIGEVLERLRTARVVTLAGPGGIGKTRLAIRAASDLLDEYEDGVWFSDLSPLADPTNVPHTVAASCGVAESPDASAAHALEACLADRNALLVLDNCEQVVDGCAALVERLLAACPNTRFLATSRERLGVRGEVVWPVAPLTVPAETDGSAGAIAEAEAVRLFVGRARLVRPTFEMTPSNASAIGALCRRLEGIPLAVELAAARVNVLSVEQILARIDDRFRLLASGDRNVAARQRTLRAALDWSYALLSEEERAVLMRLAIFPAGCSIEAAEAVCAPAGLDVLALVSRLVDKSLVRVDEARGEARYRLLETTRAYALERLRESGDEREVRRDLVAWATDFAAASSRELTGRDQPAWLDRTSDEHDNLRAALEAGMNDPATAVGALLLATRLARFWHMRGYVREGRSWLERVAAAAAAPDDARVEALRTAGVFANMEGDCARAQELYEQALVLARESGDPESIGRTLANLAITLRDRGEYAAAAAAGAEALELFRRIDDAKLVSLALLNLGAILFDGGDERGAAARFAECLELKRAVGDRFGIANALTNLAGVHIKRGELERARELLVESLDLRRGLGEKRGLALSLMELGLVELDSGAPDRAAPMLGEALALREEIGDRRGAIDVVEAFARLAARRGEWERVALLAGAAAAARETLGLPIPVLDRAPLEAAVDEARRALGEEAFACALAEGRALPRERMVALAASG
jgi:predicted ATPase